MPQLRRRDLRVSFPVIAVATMVAVFLAVPLWAGELLDVNGTSLYVHRVGSGEPLVVLHGGPLLEHGYLLEHLEPLAEEYELIFFDQRLCGHSSGTVPAASVTLEVFVEDLEALRQSLGLGEIHLFAHSFGALTAFHYALAHGENLRSLVLSSPVAASSALWLDEQRALGESLSDEDRARREELLGSPAVRDGDPAALEALLRLSFETQFHDREKIDLLELYLPEDYRQRQRLYGGVGPELRDFDLHTDLLAVETPALLLYGSAEAGADLGGRELEDALRGSMKVVIDRAGHFPFIERPAEFSAAVKAFLNEQR